MEGRKGISILLAILLLPVCAQAITFTSDANIQAGDSWMNVGIYDTPPNHTTVNMFGGSVNDSMGVHDAATFNIFGGNVGELGALDDSTANISGGSIAALSISGTAIATLSQNATIYTVAVYDTGTFNMNGGAINGILRIGGAGICNMNSGTVPNLGAIENSTLNLRGGTITYSLGAEPSAVINIFGYNLVKTNTGGIYNNGQVTGLWQSGLPFTIDLYGSDTYSTINLIPEPTTLLLFGIGIFLLRKSHR